MWFAEIHQGKRQALAAVKRGGFLARFCRREAKAETKCIAGADSIYGEPGLSRMPWNGLTATPANTAIPWATGRQLADRTGPGTPMATELAALIALSYHSNPYRSTERVTRP
jgi:hypothetical protein